MKDKLESFQGLFDPPMRLIVEIRCACGSGLGGIYYASERVLGLTTPGLYSLGLKVDGWRQGKKKTLEVHSPLYDIHLAETYDQADDNTPLHGRGPRRYNLNCRPCRETAWSASPYEVRDLFEQVHPTGRKGIALFRRSELVALRYK